MSAIQEKARALAAKVKQGAYTDEDVRAVVKAVHECDVVDKDRCDQLRQKAQNEIANDGEIEIDEGAVVSLSDDGGAYVQAWVWISDDKED